jgi:hypothetical protein
VEGDVLQNLGLGEEDSEIEEGILDELD